MVERLVNCISDWLVTSKAIQPEDRKLYEYAAFNCIVRFMPFLIIVPFCIASKSTVLGVIISIIFLSIRKFSGGYHATTPFKCFIFSSIMVISLILGAKCLSNGICINVLLAVSFFVIYSISPIDSENRQLGLDEKKKYRLICRRIILIYLIAYVILTYFEQNEYALGVALSLICVAILQVMEVVINKINITKNAL